MANTYRVLGIDPGNNLGVACVEIDYDTGKSTALHSTTFNLTEYIKHHYSEVLDCHGPQVAKLIVIEKVIGDYANFWLPDFIAHETAFSRIGGVDAFASLRECILAIKYAAYKYRRLMVVRPINPNTVKYCVVGEKSSDKSQVVAAIKRLKDLDTSQVNLDALDQHGVDAIAIGYTFIKRRIYGVPAIESPKRSKHSKRNKTRSN